MNSNLPHAIRVTREALASSSPDPAASVAHALNDARLLVDPGHSYGVVLHRQTAGDRTGEQPLTELEQQALAWDQSCQKALRVMAGISEEIGYRPDFKAVRADGDRVLVALNITAQEQWAYWRQHFGIAADAERPLPYAVCGEGHRDGVRVSVVAYNVPQVRARATEAAARPFLFEGTVYDLALPQRDKHGDSWFFHGERREDGMPLLSMDSRPERCTLANVVTQVGPLTPVTTTSTAVTREGGEAA
ncbi:BN159_2729 family protein [Streptomyces sp. NPDC056337]|uniref:BN159_2729 family protein n=1 Tax=Streptomyces sp. NPDC056337 TaxID=3345787 RepID=UPI0035D5E953